MKRKSIVSWLLVCCLLCLPVTSCIAATYMITDEELLTLQQDLQTQRESNEQLQQLLAIAWGLLEKAKEQLALSDQDLQTVREQLAKLQQQLNESQEKVALLESQLSKLKTQLEQAKASSQAAENSLAETQKSWNEYQKGVKAEINSLKLQRNIAGGVAVVLVLKALFEKR